MPSRHTIRTYAPNTFYHVYNRGVEKRAIFQDEKDYKMFQYYLFVYLAPPLLVEIVYPDLKPKLKQANMHSLITLHSYVLMKNHFHLLLHQKEIANVSEFMKKITNAYTKYFNERNERVGSLFQGVYKAIVIEKDEYLLHLTKYIHKNPLPNKDLHTLSEFKWSSYPTYLNNQECPYINTQCIKKLFPQYSPARYKNYVEDTEIETEVLPPELTLEL